MPLAGAIAINFSAPLFATLVSALLLKEAVGLVRWAVLLVGFVGVLIVTNPGTETFQIGALFALANAVLYALVVGSAVVVASSLFLLWRESNARQAIAEAPRE
jgi:drug/metabolite transporter (DMT)-like permease